jgi:hypothetical protein
MLSGGEGKGNRTFIINFQAERATKFVCASGLIFQYFAAAWGFTSPQEWLKTKLKLKSPRKPKS